jgi:FKBP-type peptidyl-prolyl cis-trans isomerase FkpA
MKNISLHLFGPFFSVLFLSLFISCGGDDENELQTYITANNISAQETASGLFYTITSPGSSTKLNDSDFIVFHFRQSDLKRVELANSFGSEFPVAFSISEFIPGLKEGLQLIGDDGRITLYVPPSLSGGAITEGALVYDIEILDVYDSVVEYNDKVISDHLVAKGIAATRTPEGVYYFITTAGSDSMPTPTSSVTVNYRGYLLNDQTFDASSDGIPVDFSLNGLIPGWQIGLPYFGTGARGLLFIPSYLAYGSNGSGSIPPNYPIAFDIELLAHQ